MNSYDAFTDSELEALLASKSTPEWLWEEIIANCPHRLTVRRVWALLDSNDTPNYLRTKLLKTKGGKQWQQELVGKNPLGMLQPGQHFWWQERFKAQLAEMQANGFDIELALRGLQEGQD